MFKIAVQKSLITKKNHSPTTSNGPPLSGLIFRGAGIFLEKIVCFPTGVKKFNVFNKVKSKKFVLHSVNFFKALFPGSYKGLQITQSLTCIKHDDLLLASSVLSVNYKIRKIHRNICKDLLLAAA